MKIKQTFFFSIFLFFAFASNGHFTLYAQEVQSVQLNLNSKSNFENGLLVNQSILNTLATGVEKPLQLINISVLIKFGTDIIWEYGNQSEIQLHIISMQTSGDVAYRKFPINDFLNPDKLTGNYTVTSSGNVISVSNFAVEVASYGEPMKIGSVDIKPGKSTTINGDIKTFSYSTQAKDRFQTVVSLINQYWALNAQIDIIVSEAAQNESNQNDEINKLFVLREKIRKSIHLSKETMSIINAALSDYDPEGLKDKVLILERLFTRYTTLCNVAIESQESDEISTEVVIKSYINSLKTYFSNSNKTDFRDTDLIIKYSRLFVDNQLTSMLDNIGPKAEKSLASSMLYLNLIQMADSMFAAADYSNAVFLYEDAKMLESNYGFAKNKGELNDRIDSAKLGLLQSYLRIASRAVETGNEVLANSYKQKSNTFVSGHQQENLIGQLSEQSDELIQTYIRKANESIDYQRYNQAIQLFESASAAAKNFYNTKFNEQITNGLFIAYRNIFLELVKNAENYYAVGRSVDAKFALQQAINYREDHLLYLRTSNEASYLQNKMNENSSLSISMIDAQNTQSQQILVGNGLIDPNYKYNKSTELFDNQTVEYARDLILEKASNAGIKVWGNSLDEAWKIYDDAIALQKKYRLDADVEINNAFADLDTMIIERICLNNNFRIQDLMKDAKKKIALRNYENLSELLDEVIQIGTNNQGCDLNILEANELNEKYFQFFQYQKDYTEILSRLFNYGLKSVIEAYINFDQNIDKYQLERYGYQHTTIKAFIEIQQNSLFTLELIDYFIELINAEAVVEYIQILKQQDFTKTETIEMQHKAASLIAVSDHAKGLKEPEKRIEMIVGNDKRLSELKKVYLKSIKELQKNRPDFFKLFLKN